MLNRPDTGGSALKDSVALTKVKSDPEPMCERAAESVADPVILKSPLCTVDILKT